jgi:hypothetical protein
VDFLLEPATTSDAAQNEMESYPPLPVFRLLGQELIKMLTQDRIHIISQKIDRNDQTG